MSFFSDVKNAIVNSSNGDQWKAAIVVGGAVGLAVAGPAGLLTGFGVGVGGYPVMFVGVKVGKFVKDAYQSFKHPETPEEKERRELQETHKSANKVHFDVPVSSYARAHAVGIPPASNSSNFKDEQELNRIASLENFAAEDLLTSPRARETRKEANEGFEKEAHNTALSF